MAQTAAGFGVDVACGLYGDAKTFHCAGHFESEALVHNEFLYCGSSAYPKYHYYSFPFVHYISLPNLAVLSSHIICSCYVEQHWA